MKNKKYDLQILLGSKSDYSKLSPHLDLIKEFAVKYKVFILSAHRDPERLLEFCKKLDTKVIIAGAGLAAHLPGMLAALTHIPIIGVPLSGSSLGGLDAILSILQMPPGIPVATVGVDNFQNAIILAVRILALNNITFEKKLVSYSLKSKLKNRKDNDSIS